MAISYEDTTSSGQTDYNIIFPFLDRSHVVVKFDGSIQATSDYTFLSDSQIRLNAAAANGVVVRVGRDTPRTLLTDFISGIVSESDLDDGYLHNLYMMQEVQDTFDEVILGSTINVAADLDGAVTINESGNPVDLRVESGDFADILGVDGTNNVVSIKKEDPGWSLSTFAGRELLVFRSTGQKGIFFNSDDATGNNDIYWGSELQESLGRFGYKHRSGTGDGAFRWRVSDNHATTPTGVHLAQWSIASFLFNQSNNDTDFIYESVGSSTMLHIDAALNSVGISGASLQPLGGLLHIREADAGAFTFNTDGNGLVLESNANTGMTFVTGASANVNLWFGDAADPTAGRLQYSNVVDRMMIKIKGSLARITAEQTEVKIGHESEDCDLRVATALIDPFLFIDASASRMGIMGATGLTPTDGLLHILASDTGGTANADSKVVIEDINFARMELIANNTTGNCSILFSDPDSNGVGSIGYAHSVNTLSLSANDTTRFRIKSDAILIGTDNVTTGASANDLIMDNGSTIGFVNNAGTTSANFGIGGDTTDNLNLGVPATTDSIRLFWAGSQKLRFVEENAGGGLVFVGEASSDHTAPAANGCTIYTKDNGAGKTQLMAIFNTGAAQQLAIQP
jgi:hypothetical protein